MDTHRTIEAVWRIESPRLIAGLTRMVRDVGVAEDLAQDALVAALEQWPATGVPDNPAGWLMTIAKRRQRQQRQSAEKRAEFVDRPAFEKHQGLRRRAQRLGSRGHRVFP